MCIKYFAWFLDFLQKLSIIDNFIKNAKNMVNMHTFLCQILTPFLIDFFVFFRDFKNGGVEKVQKMTKIP